MQIMRNGKLVGNPLDGVDLDQLTPTQKQALHTTLTKDKEGKSLNAKDLHAIREARQTTPLAKAQRAMSGLKQALKG